MNIETLFLNLFTSFVRQTKITDLDVSLDNTSLNDAPLDNEAWNKLLTLSAYHQIIPIIYESASEMKSFRQHPPAIAGLWKKETMMAVARQIRMTSEFIQLYKDMTQAGIVPLVMKGIVCRNLYPKPDYRRSGDEDLLIKKKDFWAVNDFLIERGFKKNESDEDLRARFHTLHEVGYRHPQTGVYLEIHLSLFPEESGAYGHFNELFIGLHKNAVCLEIEGCKIYTLNYTEHFLYLLCHSAKHFLHSGFGVRQVFDMILFAETYGDKIDWAEIIKKTKKNHMYVFMVNLFDIGVRYLGFDPEKACWPSKAQKLDGTLDSGELLEDLLVGGVFGASSEERIHSSNITLAAANKEEKVSGLRASLFPKRSYMEKKYDYVKEHPWLLPVGWGQRILEYTSRKKKVDNVKVVETGNKRVKLLKKYGMIAEKQGTR